jgi:hypothetical protein
MVHGPFYDAAALGIPPPSPDAVIERPRASWVAGEGGGSPTKITNTLLNLLDLEGTRLPGVKQTDVF